MTTFSVKKEVVIPKKKGLMARALQHSNVLQNDSSGAKNDFSSSIAISSKIASNKNFSDTIYRTKTSEISTPPFRQAYLQSVSNKQSTQIETFSDPMEQVDMLNSNTINSLSSDCCLSPTNSLPSDVIRKRRTSKQSSNDMLLPIQEHEQISESHLSSTQHLRSGFFRTIKKQYPTLTLDDSGLGNVFRDHEKEDAALSRNSTSSSSAYSSDCKSADEQPEEEFTFMTSMARKRLKELRKVDPKKVDVATGLQWIRLELHEMREQDKALFLQLIKLHTTIKEIRNEMKFMEDRYDSCFDGIDGVASYWWPRCNGASILPDFSASDGAHLLMRRGNRPILRRGFSFNQHDSSQVLFPSHFVESTSGSLQSFSSSTSSSPSDTNL